MSLFINIYSITISISRKLLFCFKDLGRVGFEPTYQTKRIYNPPPLTTRAPTQKPTIDYFTINKKKKQLLFIFLINKNIKRLLFFILIYVQCI